MGSITTGVGLISGINTAQLIESLITLESRPKSKLQERAALLSSRRTALLDINARLLNLKNTSKGFRLNKVFLSSLATSSNPDALTASASSNAQPGTFQFIVKQLVSTSQQLTKGFADKTTTPLGLTSLSFEFGHGSLSVDRELAHLNGGAGVDRGKIVITDRSGAQATINLTDVTTLNEVIERINDAAGASVTARADGDRLIITDDSGGSGSLTVANGAGDTTATDLGIAGTVAGATLTGTNINTLGLSSSLASLNDGTGVLTRNNVADVRVTARDGTVIDVDFGRINLPISASTLLSELNNGLGVTIGDDENKDIKFVARDGTEYEVNLTGVTTVGGLITRISAETNGHIAISVHSGGARLVVTDTVGGAGNLRVLGAGDNGTETAEDLGILNVAGAAANSFNGEIIPNTISDPPAASLEDVIDRINNATNNGGKIVASLAPDGVSLLITDTTGGAGNLIIRRTTGNAQAAAALGIETSESGVAASTVDGRRLIAALGSVLVRNLNGGAGLAGNTSLTIKDRAGGLASFTLDENASLSDIIAQINGSADIDVTASLNTVGNGLKIVDNTAGIENLVISGNAAAELGIEADVAAGSVRGSNLQHQYVSPATRLSDLNYGRGIGLGRFRITDGLGESAVVDIASDSVTLQDVIEEINSRGLAIRARVNDAGDGLLIESDLDVGQTAVTKIKIESVAGTTAKDLNILGTSETVADGFIDGSYERTVTLAASDTLAQVVSKVNAAGIPVNASIVNSGSGATPFHVNFTSGISGRVGELLIDGGDVDLGLTSLVTGRDAKMFFGSSNPENGFLVTSTSNTVTTAIEGVTLNLLQASDDPITVTVTRDTNAIVAAVKQFVTNFNDAIARIDQYDFYDVDSETKGVLLGNPTTSRVREALFRTLQRRAQGVDTQYQFLRDVGIKIGSNGSISMDEEKFLAAYENDPKAVENLFAAFQSNAGGTEEILPGVTVPVTQPNVTVRGLGELFDALLDDLTNSLDGTVTLADKNFQNQVKNINDRIGEMDQRLEAKRKRLQAQFTAMEAALARLQGQSTALNSLVSNVLLAQGFTGQ